MAVDKSVSVIAFKTEPRALINLNAISIRSFQKLATNDVLEFKIGLSICSGSLVKGESCFRV